MQTVDTKFFIDDWLIDPRLNRVSRHGRTILIEPKVMQVLVCLAAQPGEVIARNHLLDQVWGDTVVTDHVLTRSISELRKVFGDTPNRPTVIETIPKTGYRLIAPVTLPEPDTETPASPNAQDARRGSPEDAAPPHTSDIAITASTSVPSTDRRRPVLSHPYKLALTGLVVVLLLLIVPIELISYLIRPISLSVRLFANMMAGHTMLKVFAGFVVSLGAFGVVPLVVTIAFTGLEFVIAFLQAFVFSVLTCIYLNDAVNMHDH